jgi:hypothetical protein
MSGLEDIIARGNRGDGSGYGENRITCADGFHLSVIAGGGTYCTPRPAFRPGPADGITSHVASDYRGPYTTVEVGFPSERPEPWDEWASYVDSSEEPTKTVYHYVPVELVRALVASHGGES